MSDAPDPRDETKALSPVAIAVALGASAGVWLLIELLSKVLR